MNKRILSRTLISLGLFTLVGAVGAQTYYTHELVRRVDASNSAQIPDIQPGPDIGAWDTWGPSWGPGWGPGRGQAGDPWAAIHTDIMRMQAQMNRMFANGFPAFDGIPAAGSNGNAAKVTLQEKGKDYVVKARIPGAKKNDINVNLNGRLLSISSRIRGTEQRKNSKGKLVQREQFARAFQQAFTLPGPVTASGMQSHFKDGVLTLTIPKAG